MKLKEIDNVPTVRIKSINRIGVLNFDKKTFTSENGKKYKCSLPISVLKFLLPHVQVVGYK